MNKFAILLIIVLFGFTAPSVEATTFEDKKNDVSFSYQQKKPLKVVEVYSVNGQESDARSFQSGKKEAMYLAYLDSTRDIFAATVVRSLLYGTDGYVDKDGNQYSAQLRTLSSKNISNEIQVIDVTIKNKKNKKYGIKNYIVDVSPESNKDMAIMMTVGWGTNSASSPLSASARYNGKAQKYVAYFKTEKEADKFMNQVVASLEVK